MVIDRFVKYMNYKGLNDNQVTTQCDLSVGLIGKARQTARRVQAQGGFPARRYNVNTYTSTVCIIHYICTKTIVKCRKK